MADPKDMSETDAGGCNPYADDETAPEKVPFTGTLPGGLVIVNGLICEVPENYPMNICPTYQTPCKNCGATTEEPEGE